MQRDTLDYFDGRGRADQKGELGLDPGAVADQELKDTIHAWNHASMETSGFCPDVDRAWLRVKSRLGKGAVVRPLAYFYWAAASVVLLLAGYFIFQSTVADEVSVVSATISAQGQVTNHQLPDGSQVWLNQGSEIRYSEREPRKILLTGEAYFKIAYKEGAPFTVSTDGVVAKVLGTEFNVQHAGEQTNVSVLEGSVEVSALDKVVVLKEGQRAVTDRSTNKITRTAFSDTNFLAWKTGVLEFRRAPLSEILRSLNQHYQVQIKLENEALSNCTLSLTLDNTSLDETLSIVSAVLQGAISGADGDYLLQAPPCEK